MLSRIYSGSRLDAYDVEGCTRVLLKRVEMGERPEFHAGAAAALSLVIEHDLRDQDEFFAAFDALYNENEDFHRVGREV